MTNTTGPVPLQSPEYIERKFEKSLRDALIKRDWALLLGPRQHGKTSALIRIKEYLVDSGFRCGFVDLQRLPPELGFEEMLAWFTGVLAHSLGCVVPAGLKGNELAAWLTATVPMPGAPVVVLIDEASSIRDEAHRNSFFGQIRALKGAAAVARVTELHANIQFVFAGTFRPETLVDDLNSPFNVCVRFDTEDLDLAQTCRLTSLVLGQSEAEVADIAQIIYSAIRGQPHLIQSLLSVAEAETPANRITAISDEVVRFRSEGSEHIRSLFLTIIQDPNLAKIAADVATNGKIINDPANIDYKFMTTIGLLRRENMHLVFRNSLYESIAQASTQLRPDAPIVVRNPVLLLPLEETNFGFIVDLELREISMSSYNGAVTAANSKNFRLAIVGFGIALEAILMDWLIQKGTAAISAAIESSSVPERPQFQNSEKIDNPLTWRLVTLMRVGRLLNGVRGPMDLPESLREFRNWVHPAVIKRSYIPEEAVGPEAAACNAFLSIIMRNIQ